MIVVYYNNARTDLETGNSHRGFVPMAAVWCALRPTALELLCDLTTSEDELVRAFCSEPTTTQ
ncbi:hypothetical protein HFX_5120 (plasmid) [Haloferax mediterranei ATCC 33500]|uniref:Uncharacterized protein n=1 Tax=Haloferax mediterranei (strain ATCC 33500 / DSM 1411 / JCM 8866 / NBRC 14739 / NCIMB 2177 / R-4) TaxID=523841 RepID=I3R9P5_HALMT|nr:hypothetical protein HFX_5120 [Haloferax mediterranei ATCC 33500]